MVGEIIRYKIKGDTARMIQANLLEIDTMISAVKIFEKVDNRHQASSDGKSSHDELNSVQEII